MQRERGASGTRADVEHTTNRTIDGPSTSFRPRFRETEVVLGDLVHVDESVVAFDDGTTLAVLERREERRTERVADPRERRARQP